MERELKYFVVCYFYCITAFDDSHEGLTRTAKEIIGEDYLQEYLYKESPLNPYKSGPPAVGFVVVDVQKCFMPGSPLSAQHGEDIVPIINRVRAQNDPLFSVVAQVQDVHCPDDVAFASQHPGRKPFQTIVLYYNNKGKLCMGRNITSPHAVWCRRRDLAHRVEQMLWPDHCVNNTPQADAHPDLLVKPTDVMIRKQGLCQFDPHSAFEYNGGILTTGLHARLQEHRVSVLFLAGLALEYGVFFTAQDAVKRNYTTFLIIDATATAKHVSQAPITIHELRKMGVKIVISADVRRVLHNLGYDAGAARQHQTSILHILCLFVLVKKICCL